jgi:hypothetical protein
LPDPALGRFIQPDSIVPDQYNPFDWDRFSYVHSDPINNIDPTGHFCTKVGSETLCSADDDDEGNGSWISTESVESIAWRVVKRIHTRLAGVDDVEAMAQIADYITSVYSNPTDAFSFLSEVFTGIDSFNPLTLLEAAINRELNPDDSGLDFSDRGFHPDFQDGGNQVFHVWAYIIQGWWTIPGGLIGEAGNRFHEFGPSFGRGGQSQKDYDLAHSGLVLGTLIGWGIVPLNQLGNGIRYMFGTAGPGVNIP